MNESLLQGITDALSGLERTVLMLDAGGQSLFPADGQSYYLPPNSVPGEQQPFKGYLFVQLRMPERCYLCTREGEGAGDTLRLAALTAEALHRLLPPEETRQSAALRLLRGELTPSELEALLKDFDIPASLPRCVMLFQLPAVKGSTAYEQLQELLPLDEQDILCAVDPLRVALIKALDKGMGVDEAEEYARALQDTLREETGLPLDCGIGDLVSAADALHLSFGQAEGALLIGAQYPRLQGLFVWRRMLLPRFLDEIPAELAQQYHGLLFNRRTAALFSAEMVKTIDMFLEKDLNLSDTARQLYIHRNTLVYRLDKVQRLSGLDLRRFEDAFVYKLFASLRHKPRKQEAAANRPQKGTV